MKKPGGKVTLKPKGFTAFGSMQQGKSKPPKPPVVRGPKEPPDVS